MFSGTFTALITPFEVNGDVDEKTLRLLIDRQFENNITGIVPVGTTGESPTLNYEEHCRIIEISAEQTNKRGLMIAGTGANATREAIMLTQFAEKAGADASLQVCPYYNKPSQEGLYEHFKTIAQSTSLPIILYSIPGRSVIEISVETVSRLAEDCPNIVAIKEAGGSTERVNQLYQQLPETFQILSGDDSLTLPFMSVGATGVISVASNLIPKTMSELVSLALENQWEKARALHHHYYPLFHAMLKLDTNPVPIKIALSMAKLCNEKMRRPLVPFSDTKKQELQNILQQLDIIS